MAAGIASFGKSRWVVTLDFPPFDAWLTGSPWLASATKANHNARGVSHLGYYATSCLIFPIYSLLPLTQGDDQRL